MNLLLIGATGMSGSCILAEAVLRGHHVTAAVRETGKLPVSGQITPVRFDIHADASLPGLSARADVVVSAVSPRNGGDKADEAMSCAEALIRDVGKTRLVMVGGAGSLNLEDGTAYVETVKPAYYSEATAMRAAFERIAASDLNYTVLAPAAEIAPGERTGTFRLGENRKLLFDADGNSAISAEDFAIAVLDEIETPAHPRQIFNVAY